MASYDALNQEPSRPPLRLFPQLFTKRFPQAIIAEPGIGNGHDRSIHMVSCFSYHCNCLAHFVFKFNFVFSRALVDLLNAFLEMVETVVERQARQRPFITFNSPMVTMFCAQEYFD